MSEHPLQYIVVRNDLHYPVGALMAQAAHAAVLAIHTFKDDRETAAFLSRPGEMRTVILQCTRDELARLEQALSSSRIKHAPWVELPENDRTAIGLAPTRKSAVAEMLRGLRLF